MDCIKLIQKGTSHVQLSAAKLSSVPQSFVFHIYIMLHLEDIFHHYQTHINSRLKV